MNGVLEGSEKVVPLGVREGGLRLVMNGLLGDECFDSAHWLTSHLRYRYPTWDGSPMP